MTKSLQNIERILLQGEGKHFCAGGDVKSVHLSGPSSQLKREFFAKEYSLNLKIKHLLLQLVFLELFL